MKYLKELILPGARAENSFVSGIASTAFTDFYPFNVFPRKGVCSLEFDNVTLLYGTNGSGKSTLINIIAGMIGAARVSDFNDSSFFEDYLGMCYLEYYKRPKSSIVLTSDDVFDYLLGARSVNGRVDEERNRLFERYTDIYNKAINDPEYARMKGLDDYERWKEVRDVLSPRRSQSSYVKKRVARNIDLYSNGESAMRYFVDAIDGDAVYLLDEPENSLSPERQAELSEYIRSTARVTDCQFVIATHSPFFLSIDGARVYNLDGDPASVCEWTELPGVRKYFEFFMSNKDKFEIP